MVRMRDIVMSLRNRQHGSSIGPEVRLLGTDSGKFTITPVGRVSIIDQVALGAVAGLKQTALLARDWAMSAGDPFTDVNPDDRLVANVLIIRPNISDKSLLGRFNVTFDSKDFGEQLTSHFSGILGFHIYYDVPTIGVLLEEKHVSGVGRSPFFECESLHLTRREYAAALRGRSDDGVDMAFSSNEANNAVQPVAPTPIRRKGTLVADIPTRRTQVAAPPIEDDADSLLRIRIGDSRDEFNLRHGSVIGRYDSTAPGVLSILPWDTASAEHFRVEKAGDQILVRDLGSTNGTFVRYTGGMTKSIGRGGQEAAEISPGCRVGIPFGGAMVWSELLPPREEV